MASAIFNLIFPMIIILLPIQAFAQDAESITPEQVRAMADHEAINMLATQLNISVQDINQAKTAVVQSYVNYYENLRQCRLGTYKYALPSPNGGTLDSDGQTVISLYYFPVTTIQGLENHVCTVITDYKLQDVGNIHIKCQFREKSLDVFTAEEARYIANGNHDILSPVSRVTMEQCKLYLDGKLLQS